MERVRPFVIVLAAIGAVMLVATLAYPFGYDQAVFGVGGEMLLKGAVPYRDFLDTKQPLIFYLYAIAIGVCGRHDWSVHLLDVLYQAFAAYCFFRILRREFSAEIALLSASLMLILYSGSGFWMTCEAESFAIVPSLLLFDVTLRTVTSKRLAKDRFAFQYGLLAGVAVILLVLLKFTLVLGGLAAMVFVLSRPGISAKIKWRYSIAPTASSLALATACVLLLWWADALTPFLQSLGWLWHYSAISGGESVFKQMFLAFPERLIYSTSVSLFVLGATGIFFYYKKKYAGSKRTMLTLLLLTGMFQLIGVLVERKVEFPYQYTRALWAFTPFISLGIVGCVQWLKKLRAMGGAARLAIGVVVILSILLLSPLQRIVTQTIPWTQIALSGTDAAAEVQQRVPDYFAEDEQQVASYLSKKMATADPLFFWGNDVALYFHTNKVPQTMCLTATPFRSANTPSEWKTTLLKQLSVTPPRYIVVEFGDAKPYITGSPLDSYQALLAWNGLATFLSTRYTSDTTIGHFRVFRGK